MSDDETNMSTVPPLIEANEKEKWLASVSYNDAVHDIKLLGNELSKNAQVKASFKSGLPFFEEKKGGEEAVLNSVLHDNFEFDDIPNITQNFLNPMNLRVGIEGENTTSYTAVKFIIKCTNNQGQLPAVGNVGADFCENTKIFGETGSEAIFVVDFNQHGFLAQLKQGTRLDGKKIHIVKTPEGENDPAGKTEAHNVNLFDNDSGVELQSWIQIGN